MYQITYVGDWKKLIPLGYRFQRLYASNYICYHKSDLGIWIWKKNKCVEIEDLYGKSYLVLQYLIINNFQMPKFNRVVIDFKENKVEEHNYQKHEITFRLDSMSDVEIEGHYKRYRAICLKSETIEELKFLYFNKLISITNN